MPILTTPSNDTTRYTFLKTCADTIASDNETGTAILSSKTQKLITEGTEPFKSAVESLSATSAVRAKEVDEKNISLKKLNTYIRDFWIAARNRINREELPVATLKYYLLPLSGLLPPASITSALLTTAESLIAGDAQAVAAGFAPMANPSAEELTAILAVAKDEHKDIAIADEAVDASESAVAKVRTNADKAFKEVVAELKFFLRDEEEASLRRIMRRYGIVFKSDSAS